MKAQISFEYITALLLFIVFVTYISFQILSITPSYLGKMEEQRLRSEAYQVSELLINDPGEPINWDEKELNEIKRLGLSDHTKNVTNLVSLSKITNFATICNNNYDKVRALLGVEEHQFSVFFVDKESGLVLISCVPEQIISRALKVNITRTTAFTTPSGLKYGELILQMW